MGQAVRVRPLGVFHTSTFAYDSKIKHMIDVYFVMSYEGGRVVPGDDMAGSQVLWRDLASISEQGIQVVIPPNGISILRRAVQTWRLWKDSGAYPLDPWISNTGIDRETRGSGHPG